MSYEEFNQSQLVNSSYTFYKNIQKIAQVPIITANILSIYDFNYILIHKFKKVLCAQKHHFIETVVLSSHISWSRTKKNKPIRQQFDIPRRNYVRFFSFIFSQIEGYN